jgi:hypothetical protein
MEAPSWRHGRYSRWVPRSLLREFERAAADPELTGLRFELEALSVRTEQLLRQLDEPVPDWAALEAAVGRVEAVAAEPDALRVALGELKALVRGGKQASVTSSEVWSEVRDIIQERTKVAMAENRRLVEAGLSLPKERALALVVVVQTAVRDTVTDPDVFDRGPQAVMTALHQRLCHVLRGPEPDEGLIAAPGAD